MEIMTYFVVVMYTIASVVIVAISLFMRDKR